jgi:hypothetical protein
MTNKCNTITAPADLGLDIIWDPLNLDKVAGYPADGSSVSSILDLGRSGNNLSQATGAAQPIFKRDIINGNPILRFSGAQWMSSPAGANNAYAGAMSVFVVWSTPNTSPAPIARTITKVSSWTLSYVTEDIQFGLFAGGSYTADNIIANDTVYNTGTVFNGSTATDFYRNGELFTTVSAAGTMSGTASDLYFGSRDGTQHFITGDVGFLCVAYRALSSFEIGKLNTYLNIRFGV